MATIQATNNFVFILRDAVKEETADGLWIPAEGRERPHTGTVVSAGELVQDKNIKDGKRVMFHKGNGFDIPYEQKTYLVIEGDRVIAILG